jgi:hypothetical protein
MESDMLEVSFERIVLTACGKKEKVVQAAASSPIKVINCTNEFYAIYSFSYHFTHPAKAVSQLVDPMPFQ